MLTICPLPSKLNRLKFTAPTLLSAVILELENGNPVIWTLPEAALDCDISTNEQMTPDKDSNFSGGIFLG